jgi:hypothetical protein
MDDHAPRSKSAGVEFHGQREIFCVPVTCVVALTDTGSQSTTVPARSMPFSRCWPPAPPRENSTEPGNASRLLL